MVRYYWKKYLKKKAKKLAKKKADAEKNKKKRSNTMKRPSLQTQITESSPTRRGTINKTEASKISESIGRRGSIIS